MRLFSLTYRMPNTANGVTCIPVSTSLETAEASLGAAAAHFFWDSAWAWWAGANSRPPRAEIRSNAPDPREAQASHNQVTNSVELHWFRRTRAGLHCTIHLQSCLAPATSDTIRLALPRPLISKTWTRRNIFFFLLSRNLACDMDHLRCLESTPVAPAVVAAEPVTASPSRAALAWILSISASIGL